MTRPTAIGAYIFQGSQTVGISKHFDVLAHFEDGRYGVETAKKNFPELPIYTDVNTWPVEEFLGKIDLVYCNPPCAVFSNAGRSHGSRDGWRKDPRLSCYRNCFGLLDSIAPKVLTIESVTNAYTNGREFMVELEQRANEKGYNVTHVFVDAILCGVPQFRRRHFFVAHKMPIDFKRPNKPQRTVKDVLGRIKKPGWSRPVREDLKQYMPMVKANEGLRKYWEIDNPPEAQERDPRGFVRGRPRMMEARLPWDTPMGAFIGDFYIHPIEDRNLGVNEARALCCYPSNWKLGCPDASAFSEFARAVLPPVADWLGEQIAASLSNSFLNDHHVDHVDFIRHSLFGE
jgi:site-specific DNA-cytosine methylase